jgi:hypothetical protein
VDDRELTQQRVSGNVCGMVGKAKSGGPDWDSFRIYEGDEFNKSQSGYL